MNKGFKIEGWLIESWESGPLVNYQTILTNTVDSNLNFSIIRTNSKSPKITLKSSHIQFTLYYFINFILLLELLQFKNLYYSKLSKFLLFGMLTGRYKLNIGVQWAIPFFFIHAGGWTSFSRGVFDPKISRGFLMKMKDFPGGYKKKKFQGLITWKNSRGYNCRSFQGH